MIVGVKQGYPLSPLAFGLFFDRVVSQVAQDILPSQKGNALHIPNLIVQLVLYTDDLAIFAPNASALWYILTSVDLFCYENGLRINKSKTQYIM